MNNHIIRMKAKSACASQIHFHTLSSVELLFHCFSLLELTKRLFLVIRCIFLKFLCKVFITIVHLGMTTGEFFCVF